MKLDLDGRYFNASVGPAHEIDPPASDAIITFDIFGPDSASELVIKTPPWHNGDPHYIDSAQRVAARGKRVLVCRQGGDILSASPERTLENHRAAGRELVRIASEIQANGDFTSTHLVTYSLGGITGMWAVEHGLEVNKITAVTNGDTLADCIAEGRRTQHLWKVMQAEGWSIDTLREFLHELAPANNVRNTRGKQVVSYLSTADRVIPYRRGLLLAEAFEKAGAHISVRTIPFIGHYPLIGLYLKYGRP